MARGKSWLSFVSKHKKNSHRLDDLVYALCLQYLQNTGHDWTVKGLHQFCIDLIGDSFAFSLLPLETIDLKNVFVPDLKIIGHTYECWRHLDRPATQARIQTANKSIDLDLLISFTQIYTPDWVVDYLIEKTVISNQATVIDPACGTGNFLLRVFDRLVIQNQAESKNILQNQLYGADIDETALSICALSLALRLIQLNQTENMHNTISGLRLINQNDSNGLGSLYKNFPGDHPLSKRYDAVLTNPPYIGRRLISREFKESLKQEYKDSYQDLSAAFLSRCLDLTAPGGRTGMITQASLLNLPAFDKLRRNLINNHNLVSVVDAGTKVFPLVTGEKVNSALVVIEKSFDIENKFEYRKLTNGADKSSSMQESTAASLLQESLKVSYRLGQPVPQEIIALMQLSALENYAAIKQGLATTDNARFVKLISEVSQEELGKIWFPYVKGAGSARWYAPVTHVVDWQDNGRRIKESVREKYPYLKGKANWVVKNESFYFKPGICFSFVSTSGASFRQLPEGAIFDVGASAIFPFDQSIDSDFLLAYLNSSLCVALLQYINPTINNQVGDVRKLPVIPMVQDVLSKNARRLVELSKAKSELNDPADLDDLLIEIDRLEKENNSLVLAGAAEHFNWSTAQKNNVQNWIGRNRSKNFAPVY